MSTVPSPPPEDNRERLAEARVLFNDPAHRLRAVRMLERIVSEEASGSPWAAEARELLQAHDAMIRVPERRDPLTDSMRDEWLQIHRPWDGRLRSFLDRLRQRPVQMDDLLPRVVPDLRDWLAQGKEEIRRSLQEDGAPPDRKHLDAVIALADQVSGIPRLAAELREDLTSFLEARFGLLLSSVAAEVRRCCAEWSIERAWELMKQLEARPAAYEDDVRRLEAMIGAADELRARVEVTLGSWPDLVPDQWAQLRVILEAVGAARGHLASSGVPGPIQRDLQQRVERALEAGLQFLHRRAAEAGSLEDLRDFWRHYQRLRPWETDGRLEAQPEWFGWALAKIEGRLVAEVAAVESPGELESLRYRANDLTSLPPLLVARFAACATQIEKLAGEWRRMEAGEEFTAPQGMALAHPAVVPSAFAAAVPRFRALFERTQRGLELLRQPGDLAARERACEEALRDALAVLDEVPTHGAARRLQSLAQSRKLQLSLDRALERWDVEGFLALAGQVTLESPYRELAGGPGALRALADLAARATLTTTFEAASWWRRWRGEIRLLPGARPESLEQALQAETGRRRGEWTLALDRLLEESLPPDSWHAAAESLAEGAGEPALEAYVQEVLRCETVGRIDAWIAEGRWTPAEELLTTLPERDPNHRRLATRLAVERARAAGGSALANELARSWADVLAVYGGEAYQLLTAALGETWKRCDGVALRGLTEVARRVLRSPSAPQAVRDPLQDWLGWLQIQASLAEAVTASGLQSLVTYAATDPPVPERRQRVAALVERWREKGLTVALAWAYQAFRELFETTAADPAEALAEHREQLAEQVARELESREDLERDELEAMRREVDACERDWRDLDDFLDLLSRTVYRHPPSVRFSLARRQLVSLLRTMDDLDLLESSDLRQEPFRSRWNAAWQALSQELSGLPAAAALKLRLERLDGLTRLTFFERQVRGAAERCGDRQELGRDGQFAEVARAILALIERFDRAGRTGGGMWQAISREYWTEIPALAGSLLPPPEQQDLQTLAQRFEELEADELSFRQALQDLGRNEPWVSAGGGFRPESHLPYLALYPLTPPGSRRVFWLFDRSARIAPHPDILRASTALLPTWITEYLKGGIP